MMETRADGSVVIKLCVKQNFELKSFILGYGSAVTVLEPLSLRQEMKEQAIEILKKYS
jgi:predicted DNA-binding transcriptional regulator YafY